MKLPEEVVLAVAAQKLQQIVIEDRQSVRNIREKVLWETKQIISNTPAMFIECEKLVRAYRGKEYYESKTKRIASMKDISDEVIVLELLAAVVPFAEKTPIQGIAHRLGVALGFENVLDGVKTASEIIGVCARTGFYHVWRDPLVVRSRVQISERALAFIDRTKYLNPMVCTPLDWTNNKNGGYLSIRNSVLLKQAHHSLNQSLDTLNILQQINWELDLNIVNCGEKPQKPLDTEDKHTAYVRYINKSIDTYQELMNEGNSFYFVWRYDSRGRCYSQGYYVNLQSTSYKKASLNFKHKQVIRG